MRASVDGRKGNLAPGLEHHIKGQLLEEVVSTITSNRETWVSTMSGGGEPSKGG